VQKTNLLIFITPHILGNQEDLDNMTEQRREQIEPLLPNSTKSLGPGSAAGDASEGEETGQ
jgi:type II secretory pathway component GspD/PulD (secretin)